MDVPVQHRPENTNYVLRVGPPDTKDGSDTKQGLTVDGIQGEAIEAQPPATSAGPAAPAARLTSAREQGLSLDEGE